MAGSINKVILVGNLGRDPEVRHTAAGAKIVHLSVATSDVWKDKNGERQEKTEWHRVVIFNPNLADFAERTLKKGSKVYVEGSLQTRKFQDASGQDKFSTEIILGSYRGELVVLEGRADGVAAGDSTADGSEPTPDAGWDSAPTGGNETFNDEIPF
ncbi:MAG: single-stranded DNA-binding protein [Alphaproteobacteria bacterium]|nr:single-stranded DNA-binding protein [Alphaproteobacteria bacterium]